MLLGAPGGGGIRPWGITCMYSDMTLYIPRPYRLTTVSLINDTACTRLVYIVAVRHNDMAVVLQYHVGHVNLQCHVVHVNLISYTLDVCKGLTYSPYIQSVHTVRTLIISYTLLVDV